MTKHEIAREWLIAHRDDMVAFASRLCAIPSYKQPPVPGAAFGEDCRIVLDVALAHARDLGLDTQRVEEFGGVAMTAATDADGFVLMTHLDVVPAQPDDWVSPPFAPEVRGGWLYARGAVDNKGPAVASLYAVAALKAAGVSLNRQVQVFFGTDEESGWNDLPAYCAVHQLPREGIAPDGCFPVINAEKGIAWLEAEWTVPAAGIDVIASGTAANVVPDSAQAVVNGKKLSWTGRAAHGSHPELGDNAAVKMAQDLVNNYTIGENLNNVLDFISRSNGRGDQLGLACADVSGALTMNVGEVKYDGQTARVVVDIRVPVTHDLDAVIAKWCELVAQRDGKAKVINRQAPLYLPAEDPLIRKLVGVWRNHGGEGPELMAIGGGTYARALERGVAFGPVDHDAGLCAHQPNEKIALEDLYRLADILLDVLVEVCGEESPEKRVERQSEVWGQLQKQAESKAAQKTFVFGALGLASFALSVILFLFTGAFSDNLLVGKLLAPMSFGAFVLAMAFGGMAISRGKKAKGLDGVNRQKAKNGFVLGIITLVGAVPIFLAGAILLLWVFLRLFE